MAPFDPGNDFENSRFAVGRMEDPGEDLDRGRLPCAVRPDVRDALASLNSERQLVDGFDPSPTPSAGTGVRQGEAFGVILSNVDLDRAELRVDRQVVLRVGQPPEFAPPKTDASLRTIPLPTAVRRSGVRPDLTFHDLRHYYASLLIRHGESVKVVQRRLGHKTAQETLDTYGHLWPDSDGRTREAVDGELFRATTLDGPGLAVGGHQ